MLAVRPGDRGGLSEASDATLDGSSPCAPCPGRLRDGNWHNGNQSRNFRSLACIGARSEGRCRNRPLPGRPAHRTIGRIIGSAFDASGHQAARDSYPRRRGTDCQLSQAGRWQRRSFHLQPMNLKLSTPKANSAACNNVRMPLLRVGARQSSAARPERWDHPPRLLSARRNNAWILYLSRKQSEQVRGHPIPRHVPR